MRAGNWPQRRRRRPAQRSLDLSPAPDTEGGPAAQVYTAVAERFAALGPKTFVRDPELRWEFWRLSVP